MFPQLCNGTQQRKRERRCWGDSPGGEGNVATEANAVPIAPPPTPTVANKPKELDEVWWPERVSLALRSSADFADFKRKRVLTFAHFFSGKEDVLEAGIARWHDGQDLLLRPKRGERGGLSEGAAVR